MEDNQSSIRTLFADEIECRVGATVPNACSLLLYKDARVDMKMLDAIYGPMNWQREHTTINGSLFCTIKVRNPETGEWIAKQDVGTESNTEKEKGQASDAFKRAGFNWGIGRELYSAPQIWINLGANDYNKAGKIKTRFKVADIGYNDNREINRLTIVDNMGNVRYQLGVAPQQSTTTQTTSSVDATLEEALKGIKNAKSVEKLTQLWQYYTEKDSSYSVSGSPFYNAWVERRKEFQP